MASGIIEIDAEHLTENIADIARELNSAIELKRRKGIRKRRNLRRFRQPEKLARICEGQFSSALTLLFCLPLQPSPPLPSRTAKTRPVPALQTA